MGSMTTVTSKMELFVTIFNSCHSLEIVTKVSILDVEDVLDWPLLTDIFPSQSWILIHLKPISPLYRSQSMNCNGKEDAQLV